MQIDRSKTLQMSSPPEATFTGDVQIGGYFRRDEPSRLAGATVMFAPGARTPWKMNPYGQTIIIMQGTGWVQSEGAEIVEVKAGDVIWFTTGERHWEGATPDKSMIYFAMQEKLGSNAVSFGAKVSDEEYSKGPLAA